MFTLTTDQIVALEDFLSDLRKRILAQGMPPDYTPYDVKQLMADAMRSIADQGSTPARKQAFKKRSKA